MKRAAIPAFFTLALLTAFQRDPMRLFYEARNQINDSTFISYGYQALWPNPVGTRLRAHARFAEATMIIFLMILSEPPASMMSYTLTISTN